MYLRIAYLALIAGAIAAALSFHEPNYLDSGIGILLLAAVGELVGYWQRHTP